MSSLPKFCVDGEHRAALVVGRATELGPISTQQIERCVEIAAEHASRTDLPLTFVIATAPGEESIYGGAVAGILVAHAKMGLPGPVNKAQLGRHAPSDVPEAFFQALGDAGARFAASSPDEDPEAPNEGLFLVPGGWSIARLSLGAMPSEADVEAAEDAGEDPPESSAEQILGCAAEDTMAPRVVSAEILARIASSSEPLTIAADYC